MVAVGILIVICSTVVMMLAVLFKDEDASAPADGLDDLEVPPWVSAPDASSAWKTQEPRWRRDPERDSD